MTSYPWTDKIAIIGASGFLGNYLYETISPLTDVIGTQCFAQLESFVDLNVLHEEEVKGFIKRYRI
jgi:dTDP-4-dehydrorhamnose reductase